jgi:L-lactate dehydrogenase complex protein LldF
MDIRCEQFRESSRKALSDKHLQAAMATLEKLLTLGRRMGFAGLEDAESLRDRANDIRKRSLDRLGDYLERLEERVTRLGGTVHWARTASEAREIICRLAADRGVRTVVKGKSMVSEEISLNDALKESGVEVFETDLGEFIIQLAGEPPSHLVGPAIHKTVEQVSRLFSEKFGVRRMEHPGEMTLFARRALRQRFLEADMGVTGVNFAVAETGTVILFENEGNIRLSTTLPRVHVALMGIEKVIPTMEDAAVLMKLLARSCTGQKLPTYVSMINGPRGPEESDGAGEFHLVILDNGRTRILEQPDLRETLYCIRCGACLNACPVYLKAGGHAYGWVYSGPIGAILTPQLVDRKQASVLPFASTLCGACRDVCPVKINIPRVLLALRRRYAEDPDWEDASPLMEKGLLALYARITENRGLYDAVSWAARVGQRPLTRNDRFVPAVRTLAEKTGRPEMRPLASKRFSRLWRERGKSGGCDG